MKIAHNAGADQKFMDLQDRIAKTSSTDSVYKFALTHQGNQNIDIPYLQTVILDHGSGYDAYRFAKDINGADLFKL